MAPGGCPLTPIASARAGAGRRSLLRHARLPSASRPAADGAQLRLGRVRFAADVAAVVLRSVSTGHLSFVPGFGQAAVNDIAGELVALKLRVAAIEARD